MMMTCKGLCDKIFMVDKKTFVTGYDLERYDVSEDIDGNEIDGKKIFRDMLEELCWAGARISIYQDGEMISMKFLDYRLKIPDKIWRQVKQDIERIGILAENDKECLRRRKI